MQVTMLLDEDHYDLRRVFVGNNREMPRQCEKQNLRFVHEHKKNGDFWHNLRTFFCAAL